MKRAGSQRMAFAYDVFVSYAQVDDLPFDTTGPDSAGWVTRLVRHLENYLAQQIGRTEGFTIWKDKSNLRGNDALKLEIRAVLRDTAIFIAILSPGYLASAWCQDEVHLFTQHFAGNLAGRVLVVERARLDERAEVPPRLTGLRNYRFWYVDGHKQPRTFARPMPEEQEIQYFRQVEDLARDVCRHLEAMAGGPRVLQPPMRPLTGGGVNVAAFLAEVTDDLEHQRLDVRRYLEQRGVSVLPEASLPLGRTEFEAALDAALARSQVFVQLLGPIAGKRPPDVPDGFGWLQLDRALQRGMHVLQWRSPELELADIECARHRELLQLETVQATSLETFKSAVTKALTPPPAPPPSRAMTDRPFVFLNTEPRHVKIAADIRAAIGSRAVLAEPLRAGLAEEMRTDFEQNLVDCDAMVIVYADNVGWARAQLRAFVKQTPQRKRPVRAIPVIDAPAERKPQLAFYIPEIVIINGRGGLGLETWAELSAALRL
jgi:hypothetical protein